MARADLQFPPQRFASSRFHETSGVSELRASPAQLLRISGFALAAALAIASPSFAQRGGAPAGGGGGSSHASAAPSGGGGSHSGGGSSGGGGGARSSGGSSGSHASGSHAGGHWGGNGGGRSTGGNNSSRGSSASGGRSGASTGASQPRPVRGANHWVEPETSASAKGVRSSGIRVGGNGIDPRSRLYDEAGNRGAGLGSIGSAAVQPGSRPQATGFRAAIRRFLGIKSASPAVVARVGEVDPGNSVAAPLNRAIDSPKLPPAFNRIRLSQTSVALKPTESAAFSRFSWAARPQPGLRHRPQPPFPRRFPPGYAGGYSGYWSYSPDYWFGFPFFLGFDYFGSCSCCAYNQPAAPTMFLYLNDGSAVEVTDYWVDADTLYYTTESGKHGSVLVSDVDLQRTADANARLGFRFTLDRGQPGLPLDPIQPQAPPIQQDQLDPSGAAQGGNGPN